jgi:SAM-dependent methyltransferase
MNTQEYSKLANEKWNGWIKERGIQIFAIEDDLNKFLDLGKKEVELFLEPYRSQIIKPNFKKITWDTGFKTYMHSNSIQEYFDKPLSELLMLEFGCGAGRLLLEFARHFKFVYGYDISEEAIKLLKDIAIKLDIYNLSGGAGSRVVDLFTDDNNFHSPNIDFVFSYIVLQHISNKDTIIQSFKDIKEILKKNGVARLHVRLTNSCYSNETDCFAGWGLNWDEAINFYKDLCKSIDVELLDFTDDGGRDAGFVTFRK